MIRTDERERERPTDGPLSAKQALLARWLKARPAGDVGASARIERRPRGSLVPLSSSQRRLWDWEKNNAERAPLNLFYVVRIRGPLDPALLRGALQEIADRHENLRLTIDESEGQPVPRFADRVDVELPVRDLSALTPEDAEREALREAHELGWRRFDLDRGPVFRLLLFRLALDHHFFLTAIHHIVFDVWSMGVVLRELAALYAAGLGAPRSTLAPLPIQFGDFARWESQWMQGPAARQLADYWRREVGTRPEPLLLKGGKRSGTPEFEHGRITLELDADSFSRVRTASQRNGVSLFTTLLAAFQVALWCLSDAAEVVVAIPAANRNFPDVDRLIGFFVNSVPVRVAIRAGEPFSEVLARVRRASQGALAHQAYPLSEIAAMWDQAGDYRSGIQAVFSYQNAPVPELSLGGLTLEPLVLEYGPTTVDVALYLIDSTALMKAAGGLGGFVNFNRAIYQESDIWRLWRAFERVLAISLERPGSRIAEIRSRALARGPE